MELCSVRYKEGEGDSESEGREKANEKQGCL